MNLKKNVLVEGACRVATSLLALILVPVIIRHVGVAGYGTWAILLTVAQVLMLFQSAINGTLLWSLSKSFNDENKSEIKRLVGIGLTTNIIHIGIVLIVFFVLRSLLISFFKVPMEFAGIMIWVMLGSLLGGLIELTNAVVSGAQKMALSSSLRTLATFLQQIVSLLLLFKGYGLISLVIGFFCNQILCLVGGRWLVHRVAPHLKIRLCWPNAREIHQLRGYGASLVVGSISATLRAQLDRLVLAGAASLVWVGYYEIATRLCSLIFEFNRYFFMPLIPASAALQAQGKKLEINRLFTQFMTITGFATGIATVIIGGIHDRILLAWLGSVPAGAVLILYILLVSGFIQLILTGPGSAICRGIGKANVETQYLTVSLIINLILTLVLVKTMGFLGTVIASAIATLISSVYFCFFLHKSTSLPASESWRTLRNCCAVVASIAFLRFLILFVVPVPLHFSDRWHAVLWLFPLVILGMFIYSVLFLAFDAGDNQTIARLTRRIPLIKLKRA